MARSDAVWGIDLGQCALKALRCRPHAEAQRVLADAFDYIEYPKILSQPGSDPAELIGDALKQFLSRNSVKGDRVAISVSGQAGLARFIKLPPVEAKKIPDIVRYEARQQIPFDLNDVIWDYQRMGGGSEAEGFALETEVGLFAMKRDAVFRALEPFQKAGIEVDFVQLTPLALYNFVLFDQLTDLPPPDQYDPENPPESVAVISLGTDATDLMITNGYRVWQRSVPLGGNHFTKVLTKQLKLTFAKAEHLKRNAAAAQDPKAVFQAMRPVFSDLLTELQRSLGYFTSIDRAAKIKRVIALGSAIKLPGLRRYLSQSLGFEIERLEAYRGLVGPQVLAAPAFKENALCFGACYGLALQGLGKGGLRTNLLPKEILKDRLIRQKKPWAVAAAAVLLLACAVSFASYSFGLGEVRDEKWGEAESRASNTANQAQDYRTKAEEARKKFADTDEVGKHLVGNVEGRTLWLELLRTISDCLPPYNRAEQYSKPIPQREELHITNLECKKVADLSQWFARVKDFYRPAAGEEAAKAAAPAESAAPAPAAEPSGEPPEETLPEPSEGQPAATPTQEGPTGPGWVVQLSGYHLHNFKGAGEDLGAQFVRNTLINKLQNGVDDPKKDGKKLQPLPKEIGIRYPVLVDPGKPQPWEVVDPYALPESEAAAESPAPGAARPAARTAGPIELQRFDFVVQFCWKETLQSERKRQKEQQQKEAEKKGAENKGPAP
jgi:type IV pilus assembly protein PilM